MCFQRSCEISKMDILKMSKIDIPTLDSKKVFRRRKRLHYVEEMLASHQKTWRGLL